MSINLALIAHDNKKPDMVSFIMKRLQLLVNNDIQIFATGTTGKYLKDAGLMNVRTVLSGPLGGDAQIAAKIANMEIDCVIFLIDPLDVHPHQVDVNMLLRLCNVHNIPLATNYSTASLIFDSIINKKGSD